MKTVLLQGKRVTDRVFEPAQLKRLEDMGAELVIFREEDNASPEEAAELMRGAEVVITSWGCPKLEGAVLEAAPDLKAVLHAAGSVKHVVTGEVWERGIRVTSGAAVLSRGVAETALGLTIMSMKNFIGAAAAVKGSGWWNQRKDSVRDSIREMYGSTIGVIGGGHAGKHFLHLLKGFQLSALLTDPTYTREMAAEAGAELTGLEELLRRSDIVMVLAPEIPATYRMLGAENLALMKEGATLINLARGSLIDEDALVRELQSGRIQAILDVTVQEPPGAAHPFMTLPNVMLTGHIAGAVNNGLLAIGRFIVDEWGRLAAGEKMEGEIDPSRLDTLA
ncbi:hydroxyacid dehydrogenase [Paenibacillus lutrae]|uniref:Hydroxyacid dehydrogenase n=1 Tax=Paenibacillus lutrae TaxID=2078573 RepID=A0A7X3FH54_9BACL|nr:hydroxyacid dehydrogenase [Paenibacillus lutrae]MVO99575.1 hydroxyacid dehydrogenase [Paenibacillus lutrae]